MHTTQKGDYLFKHDGDPSPTSLVRISKWDGADPTAIFVAEIPYGVIESFVAEMVRQRRICVLESMSTHDLLK